MELEKSFSPPTIEEKWYSHWESNDYFSVDLKSTKPSFCIQLPPPNVTGTLHMGHAYQQTLMDILVRYHRMKGFNTNWVVGTDHAGIATQIVVERQVEADGESKSALGREAFLKKVWDWKKQSGSFITQQMRRLGASANWAYADTEKSNAGYFTMDGKMSKSVIEVFVQLYEKGLIYRGKRLVNWDPILQTAVSDLEVESQEESGKIWEIKYRINNSSKALTVATTRPETLLGDTAVAVSPTDNRYTDLVGKEVVIPITNRLVPIIADDYVDPKFGTGCVKITPAHDFNDYEMGLRHNLEMINIFTPDGKINDNCPKILQGLPREKARKKVLELLTEKGLLVSEKKHLLKIPRSGRTSTIIEPMLTDQWFIKMESMATKAKKAVQDRKIKFVPKNWENTYFHWLDNIKDWCISRQLWWGHQIPAWHDGEGNTFVARNEAEAYEKARAKGALGTLKRDRDVLDTWFSSSLVPFTSLGWPEETQDLRLFLPSKVLITGFDIIFFWVARMVMMSLEFTKKVPFETVYINSLVRDADGQKMSKSKGNTIDPIDLIDGIGFDSLMRKSTRGLLKKDHKEKVEKYIQKNYENGIKAYGADAVRFTFAALSTFSRTLNFDLNRCDGYRNFCNKLWNASRFVLIQCSDSDFQIIEEVNFNFATNKSPYFSSADKWIISKLHETIDKTEKAYATFRFDMIAGEIYRFVWDEYCDWYLELAKTQIRTGRIAEVRTTKTVLVYVLETILRLAHPIIPFITEELWQRVAPLAGQKGRSIMISDYPVPVGSGPETEAQSEIDILKQLVFGCRKLKSDLNITPSQQIPLYIDGDKKFISKYEPYLLQLANVSEIGTNVPAAATDKKLAELIIRDFKITLELSINVQQERKKLEKKLNYLENDIKKLKQKLANKSFIQKAPKEIVEKEKHRLRDQERIMTKLLKQANELSD